MWVSYLVYSSSLFYFHFYLLIFLAEFLKLGDFLVRGFEGSFGRWYV